MTATTARPTGKQSTPDTPFSARDVVCCAACVCLCTWFFLMETSDAYLQPHGACALLPDGAYQLACSLGLALALFVLKTFSDLFSQHTAVHMACAAVAFATSCALQLLPEPSVGALCAQGVFMGLSLGALYCLLARYFNTMELDMLKLVIPGIVLLGILLCTPTFLLSGSLRFAYALACPLLSFVLAIATVLCSERPAHIGAHESQERRSITWRSYVATACSGLIAGFAFGCLLSQDVSTDWLLFAIWSLLCLTCALIFLDALLSGSITESITMRLFLPISALVVLPMLFAGPTVRMMLAGALLAWSLFSLLCSIEALHRHIALSRLSALHAYATGRFVSVLGIVAGLLLASVAFLWPLPLSSSTCAHVTDITLVVLVLLIIFAATFVMTQDNFPYAPPEGGAEGATSGHGKPLKMLDGQPQQQADGNTDESAPRRSKGMFQLRCDIVAEEHGLSRRQKEVFDLLARGRNTEYISEKLVISPHTTKAHIYNIYQKLDIHSRQELMDLVEHVDNAKVQARIAEMDKR